MGLFSKKKKKQIEISAPNPETKNKYLFFQFIEDTPVEILQGYYKEMKKQNFNICKEYSNAIKQKIETCVFINPINFAEYFNREFDFIAIDFETANEQRISACAFGVVYVKNNTIVNKEKHLIKPPSGNKFRQRNIDIHGITKDDVADSESFEYYWKNGLSECFNNNLIVLHNASMDKSILQQLFAYYKIKDYNFSYLDTMNLASCLGLPKKLTDLANYFNIEIKNHHDPLDDALLCAQVFSNMMDMNFDISKITYLLSYEEDLQHFADYLKHEVEAEIKSENKKQYVKELTGIINMYLVPESEIDDVSVDGKAFLFTGEINVDRYSAQRLVLDCGGLIKKGVTSKVDYVIVGSSYGSKKIEKIDYYNRYKGCNIRIINEEGFNKIMEYYDLKE